MELKTKKKYLAAIVTAWTGRKPLKPTQIKRNYVVVNEGTVSIWVYDYVQAIPLEKFVAMLKELKSLYEALLVEENQKSFKVSVEEYTKEIADISKLLGKL